MGRYKGKITHKFSTNPNRPTFEETVQMGRIICLRAYLAKLSLEERGEFIKMGKELGLIT